jgi:hypothetical protein
MQKLKDKARRFAKAQSTILHWLGVKVKPYGFYVPYRYASSIPQRKNLTYFWLKELLDANVSTFESFVEELKNYSSRFQDFRVENAKNKNQPRFDNEWFSGLDAAAAYGMVRKYRPKRILEIGSGHSTRFLTQAIRDEGLSTHFHSIDPVPRREIDEICSEITRAPVDRVPTSEFKKLGKDDFLFLDGSHIALPGTDADYIFGEVFPILKAGVIVHVHDIFLPWGYPEEWEIRKYNEQNVLLGILGGKRFEILFPAQYVRRTLGKACDSIAPLQKGAFESSFWMQVKE